MPCYDSRDHEQYDPDELAESAKLRTRLDTVTRAACDLAAVLQRGGTVGELAPETVQWMKAHAAWDAKRNASEKATRDLVKLNALAKLTMDERRALGL